MKDLGYGRGYEYAHDFDEQTTAMDCLPASLSGRRFYEPKDLGEEREIGRRLAAMREARGHRLEIAKAAEADKSGDAAHLVAPFEVDALAHGIVWTLL